MLGFNKNIRIRTAGVIIKENKLLLIAHRKNNKVYWLLPGGGVDYGETLQDALVREFEEELNIKVKVNDLIYVYDSLNPEGKRHIVNLCFDCSYIEGELTLAKEKRLHDVNYFSKEEIQKLQVIPPFKQQLIDLLDDQKSKQIYLGDKWINL